MIWEIGHKAKVHKIIDNIARRGGTIISQNSQKIVVERFNKIYELTPYRQLKSPQESNLSIDTSIYEISCIRTKNINTF